MGNPDENQSNALVPVRGGSDITRSTLFSAVHTTMQWCMMGSLTFPSISWPGFTSFRWFILQAVFWLYLNQYHRLKWAWGRQLQGAQNTVCMSSLCLCGVPPVLPPSKGMYLALGLLLILNYQNVWKWVCVSLCQRDKQPLHKVSWDRLQRPVKMEGWMSLTSVSE